MGKLSYLRYEEDMLYLVTLCFVWSKEFPSFRRNELKCRVTRTYIREKAGSNSDDAVNSDFFRPFQV